MEEELDALKEKFGGENPSEDVDEEYIAALTTFMYDNAPEEVKEAYSNDDYDNNAVHEWEQYVLSGTPYAVKEVEDSADEDTAEDDDDEPHDEKLLAGETTPEEDVMLKMFSGEGSDGLSGETTPEEEEMLKLQSERIVSDRTKKNIIKAISEHRY